MLSSKCCLLVICCSPERLDKSCQSGDSQGGRADTCWPRHLRTKNADDLLLACCILMSWTTGVHIETRTHFVVLVMVSNLHLLALPKGKPS